MINYLLCKHLLLLYVKHSAEINEICKIINLALNLKFHLLVIKKTYKQNHLLLIINKIKFNFATNAN